MKTIIACVDFSPVTEEVMRRALDLAKALGGDVCLVHVVPPLPVLTGGLEVPSTAFEMPAGDRLRTARQQIEVLREQQHGIGVEVTTLLFDGLPADQILCAAKAEQAELIVIGSHGLGFLRRVFLDSTTMGVLKGARCPVVVIPSSKVVQRARDSAVENEVGF